MGVLWQFRVGVCPRRRQAARAVRLPQLVL